jgi:hypothetical protein
VPLWTQWLLTLHPIPMLRKHCEAVGEKPWPNLKPARRAASRRAIQWPTVWPTTDELAGQSQQIHTEVELLRQPQATRRRPIGRSPGYLIRPRKFSKEPPTTAPRAPIRPPANTCAAPRAVEGEGAPDYELGPCSLACSLRGSTNHQREYPASAARR